MYSDKKQNDVLPPHETSSGTQSRKNAPKPANWELIELTRLAEQEGYGASYGKFVQKTGR